MITEQMVDKALAFLREKATEAAQARANVKYLAENLKIVRSTVKLRQVGCTNSIAEDKAIVSQEYREALAAYKAAVHIDAELQFKREAADAMIRAWQTEQATLRSESKAYG